MLIQQDVMLLARIPKDAWTVNTNKGTLFYHQSLIPCTSLVMESTYLCYPLVVAVGKVNSGKRESLVKHFFKPRSLID